MPSENGPNGSGRPLYRVSTLWDLWSAPHSSSPFFGLIVQWIEVGGKNGEVWRFRDEVAAFHKILGKHSGINLGRYFVVFLDRCGVTSKEESKVCHQCP